METTLFSLDFTIILSKSKLCQSPFTWQTGKNKYLVWQLNKDDEFIKVRKSKWEISLSWNQWPLVSTKIYTCGSQSSNIEHIRGTIHPIRTRAVTILCLTIRYVSRYTAHDTIHDTIYFWVNRRVTFFKVL